MSSTNKKSGKRTYQLGARAESARRTREAILDAAVRAFGDRWFDEVTLSDVAREAGVSQQTVVNHFGSKEDLYLVGIAERWAPRIARLRSQVEAGDIDSVVHIAFEDYEQTGVGTLRALALAERSATLAGIVGAGGAAHHEWVAGALEPLLTELDDAVRLRAIRLCAVALDVRTWEQLRKTQSADEAREDMRALVESIVTAARHEFC